MHEVFNNYYMIDIHANYDAVLMKSLVNKIGYYENVGDYRKLTHSMIYLMRPCGDFLGMHWLLI